MTHPLATPTYARIDVMYGGNQEKIIKDTFTLARQSVEKMKRGEHVLYMNTLASAKLVDEAADAISARHAGKIITFSESGTELTEKLKMLTIMIEQKNVRLVVLNSFDFATQNSRQRLAIVHWARKMRDDLGVSVAIYMLHRPGEHGAMGQLALLADSIQETADWRASQPSDFSECPIINTNHALTKIIVEIRGTGILPVTPESAKSTLIYNDLEVMTAREEERIEEEILEYA